MTNKDELITKAISNWMCSSFLGSHYSRSLHFSVKNDISPSLMVAQQCFIRANQEELERVSRCECRNAAATPSWEVRFRDGRTQSPPHLPKTHSLRLSQSESSRRRIRQPHSETVFVLKRSSSFVWGEASASAPRGIPGRRRRAQTSQTRCSRSAGTLRVGWVCVVGEGEGLGRDVNGGAVNSSIMIGD